MGSRARGMRPGCEGRRRSGSRLRVELGGEGQLSCGLDELFCSYPPAASRGGCGLRPCWHGPAAALTHRAERCDRPWAAHDASAPAPDKQRGRGPPVSTIKE